MTWGSGGARYVVRLTVLRRGGWRAWRAVSGTFEHRLAEPGSDVVLAPLIDRELRRGVFTQRAHQGLNRCGLR
jgi:hypothetical protein